VDSEARIQRNGWLIIAAVVLFPAALLPVAYGIGVPLGYLAAFSLIFLGLGGVVTAVAVTQRQSPEEFIIVFVVGVFLTTATLCCWLFSRQPVQWW
jgi:hypothetical protein